MSHDTIVIGVGGMGSAALCQLARRGQRVLGLERFALGHDRGSSHGETRIIRKAYFEHPDYVPLLQRAYDLWDELAAEVGTDLFARVGLLILGGAEGEVVRGVRLAAERYALPVAELALKEVRRRFPAFVPRPGQVALFEADAGFLRVEACVRAYAARAEALGATILQDTRVLRIEVQGGGVEVHTDRGRFSAGSVVLCGGAYTDELLGPLWAARHGGRPPLRVLRKVAHWHRAESPALGPGCPVFAMDDDEGFFYGFPANGQGEVKVAEHTGGQPVADPAAVDRSLHPEDEARVDAFLSTYVRGVGARARHAVCLYTMTPDEHFLIDRLGERVVYAAGFSGHGFKFASVVGEALADLAEQGGTDLPIGFLGAGRLLR
jgi:monomeric sarcosine oxidase